MIGRILSLRGNIVDHHLVVVGQCAEKNLGFGTIVFGHHSVGTGRFGGVCRTSNSGSESCPSDLELVDEFINGRYTVVELQLDNPMVERCEVCSSFSFVLFPEAFPSCMGIIFHQDNGLSSALTVLDHESESKIIGSLPFAYSVFNGSSFGCGSRCTWTLTSHIDEWE